MNWSRITSFLLFTVSIRAQDPTEGAQYLIPEGYMVKINRDHQLNWARVGHLGDFQEYIEKDEEFTTNDEGSLIFEFDKNDSGEYITVLSDRENANRVGKVTILTDSKRSGNYDSTHFTKGIGENVVLECGIKRTDQHMTVKWTRTNGLKIQGYENYFGNKLTLHNISTEDFGEYICGDERVGIVFKIEHKEREETAVPDTSSTPCLCNKEMIQEQCHSILENSKSVPMLAIVFVVLGVLVVIILVAGVLLFRILKSKESQKYTAVDDKPPEDIFYRGPAQKFNEMPQVPGTQDELLKKVQQDDLSAKLLDMAEQKLLAEQKSSDLEKKLHDIEEKYDAVRRALDKRNIMTDDKNKKMNKLVHKGNGEVQVHEDERE